MSPSGNIHESLTVGQTGDSGDISSLLVTMRPRIVVDESGGELPS